MKLAELRSMIEISLYRRQLDCARKETAQLDSRLRSRTELNLELAFERDHRVLLGTDSADARSRDSSPLVLQNSELVAFSRTTSTANFAVNICLTL